MASTTDIILPVPVARQESSSSESSLSEPEDQHKETVPNRRDSFYESDEDLSFTSPVKNVPKKKVAKRPVPVPRKQDSVASATSYENEEAIANFKAQETLEKKLREEQLEIAMAAVAKQQELELEQRKNTFELEKTSNEPVQMDMSLSYNDYENAPMSITAVKSSFTESSPRQPSPELYDYENTSMGPLPTYEEAVSGDLGAQGQGPHGDAEFFDLDDLEAPPVPVRQDSRKALTGTEEYPTNNTLSDISSEEVCIDCFTWKP